MKHMVSDDINDLPISFIISAFLNNSLIEETDEFSCQVYLTQIYYQRRKSRNSVEIKYSGELFY